MQVRMMVVALVATVSAGAAGISHAAPASGSPRVLYATSWSGGISSWTQGGGSWTVKNKLLQYSGAAATDLLAPYRTAGTRYAVEAAVKLIAYKQTGLSESNGYGLLVRASGPVDPAQATAGLMVGVGRGFVGCDGISNQVAVTTADTDLISLKKHTASFHPGSAWHVYRVEVRGNTIKLLIDGRLRLSVTTARFAGSTSVGLFSLGAQLQIKTFRVLGI